MTQSLRRTLAVRFAATMGAGLLLAAAAAYAVAIGPAVGMHRELLMVLAAIVAHVGQVMARRAKTPQAGARTVAIGIAVSLVLVMVGVLRVTHAM